MSEEINNKFKGLYDTSKTSFITDKTEPTHFYEPEVKTARIKNMHYSINFDKKELLKQVEQLRQERDKYKSILETMGVNPNEILYLKGEINKYKNIVEEISKCLDEYFSKPNRVYEENQEEYDYLVGLENLIGQLKGGVDNDD